MLRRIRRAALPARTCPGVWARLVGGVASSARLPQATLVYPRTDD